MIRDPEREDVQALLAGPAGSIIRRASEVMQAMKLGFRFELSNVPADVYAVMCCIERESNKHQIEQMRAQQHGIPGH